MTGQVLPLAHVSGSQYPPTSGVPIILRIELQQSGQPIDNFDLTNIAQDDTIIRRPGAASGLSGHMKPLVVKITRLTSDTAFDGFRGLLMTFRFRRAKARGRDNPDVRSAAAT